jgi:DMSO/TMAO reductase YedYZ molybdopterin-dependent catalytic subunit
MASRRTNLALLVLLAAALATGGLMYAWGTRWNHAATITHGIIGLAIVALSPWKSMIVRRGVARRGVADAWPSIVLGLIVVVAVVAGVVHAAGARVLGPVTAMQVHVGAALVAVPLAIWHVITRPVRPRIADLDRRALLRGAGLTAGAAASYVALESVFIVAGARGTDRRFTGSHEVASGDPRAMPVTQWFDDEVPTVDAGRWRLAVTRAGWAKTWTLAELHSLVDEERAEITATLDCTGGWYAEQRWAGVPISRLLEASGANLDGQSIRARSMTGYDRRYPIGDADRLLLATEVGGEPLSVGHGFPARIVAPGRRGFWWVKWLDQIHVSDRRWWLQPPFPLT